MLNERSVPSDKRAPLREYASQIGKPGVLLFDALSCWEIVRLASEDKEKEEDWGSEKEEELQGSGSDGDETDEVEG